MKFTHACAVAGMAMLVALPAVATGAPSEYKATGGGQILVPDGGGAGDTIAFNAQGNADAAKGRVTYIDRNDDNVGGDKQFHGIVDCIIAVPSADGGYAEIAGHERDTNAPFTLRVTDNGEGAKAVGDMIFFDDVADDEMCAQDDNDDDDAQVELARGNVQIHKAKGGPGKRRAAGTKSGSTKAVTPTVSLAGLR